MSKSFLNFSVIQRLDLESVRSLIEEIRKIILVWEKVTSLFLKFLGKERFLKGEREPFFLLKQHTAYSKRVSLPLKTSL